jgi:hypothetical protein
VIFSLLSLEASFLLQFLPTSFFLRLALLFALLFFALKFDIIEKINKENGSYSNRY